MKNIKKVLSLVLVVCMLLSLMPVGVLAADYDTDVEIAVTDETTNETNPAEEAETEPEKDETLPEETAPEMTEPAKENMAGEASMEIVAEPVAPLASTGTKPADGTVSGSNPFPSSVSNSYRGPATVVLNDGTIVVAGNIMWNTTYDGGGLDTIVSRSTDGGKTWNYTVPNYFGDNGNEYNAYSASFIDPALATDGSTIYMLVDVQAYGVSLNGASGFKTPATTTGFNSKGKLALAKRGSTDYSYYLDGNTIKDSNDTAVSGYTVDAYFNITGNGVDTNLFLEDSPYRVQRTMYLYLTKSTDGGETWSAPTLINAKTTSEMACLAAPAAGIVTSNGTIIFPCYSYSGSTESQRMSFLSSSDGGKTWTRSDNMTGASWSSESSVVELKDGTLRFFFRNGSARMYYVDYANGSWKTPVNTGIAINSNTQIASKKLSVTSDGKEVIVVSCPKGYGSDGSTSSSQNDRGCGRIFVGLVNDDGTMDFNSIDPIEVNNSMYLYSSVNELPAPASRAATEDVKLFVTYEDKMNGWGTGYSAGVTSATKTVNLNNTNTDDTTPTEPENPDVGDTKEVTLKVGESKDYTDETGNHESSYTGAGLDNSVATVQVKGKTEPGENKVEPELKTSLSNGDKIIIGNGNGTYMVLSGTALSTTTDINEATEWTVGTDSSYFTLKNGNYYLRSRNGKNDYTPNVSNSTNNTGYRRWSYSGTNGFYYSYYYMYLNGSSWAESYNTSGRAYAYTIKTTQTDPVDMTTITITGVKPGTTSVVVGNTTYKITVEKNTQNLNVSVGSSVKVTDSAASSAKSANTSIATVSYRGTDLTINGVKDGTTTVTTDTTVYNVTVSDGTALTIKAGEMNTLSVDLTSGQTVEWSTADSSYVAVAGKYANGAYTNEAMLQGQKETTSPVTVIATIKNADGTVAGTQKWLVTVTPADTKTGNIKYLYLEVDKIEHCTVYYSINAGELIKVNGAGVVLDEQTDQNVRIDVFAAPDEGYALTYMAATNSAGQYYSLSNGVNPDGTDSDGWPLKDPNATTVPANNSTPSGSNPWKAFPNTDNINTVHGSRWGLIEGNYTLDQMKLLYSQAIALGCDGVTGFTKNNEGTGSKTNPNDKDLITKMTFIAQKLPTVEKEIVSITHNGTKTNYTEGAKVELGDTINYKITVTRYATNATYGTITYSNEKLNDALTNNNGISNPSMGTSTTSNQTYTYNTSLQLTMDNFASVVKDGEIINTVDFSYNYKSQYSSGTLSSSDKAEAAVTISVPEYVVDFGLPVEIDVAAVLGDATIKNGTAAYGEVIANGKSFTYKPTEALRGIEFVNLTLNNGQSYGVRIIPATTVYYEEGFAAYTGNWTTTTNKGSVNQKASLVGANDGVYGYDAAYALNTTASDNSQAVSSTKGDSATFTFTGTGVDVYANCSAGTGAASVVVKDNDGKTVKLAIVATKASGAYGDVVSDGAYNTKIVSIKGLAYGTYSIKLTAMDGTPIHLDGFRVYGTLADSKNASYKADKEDDPTFFQMRDAVLTAMKVSENDSAAVYAQVYEKLEGKINGILVLSGPDAAGQDPQTMLKEGPKNELYLAPGQALLFNTNTKRVVELGIKGVNGTAKYTINNGTVQTCGTVDMFYQISSDSCTITNTSENTVLSITELKVCDEPSGSVFGQLTEADIAQALSAMFEEETADATLNISMVDYTGKQIASTQLTANGTVGEGHWFSAEEILNAAKAALTSGYDFAAPNTVENVSVTYGEDGTLKLQVGKVATLVITYKRLGRVIGTATLTKVQTSSSSKATFSTGDIIAAAPAGCIPISLAGTSVKFGGTGKLNVTCL